MTPAFASQVFERAVDDMGFFEQIGTFIGESAAITKIVTLPFQVVGKVVNSIEKVVSSNRRLLHRRVYGKGTSVPFRIDTIGGKVARSKDYALTHEISVQQAAKELALKNNSEGAFAKFTANRIAKFVNKKYNTNEVGLAYTVANDKIAEKSVQLKSARINGQDDFAETLSNEIGILKAERNWLLYKQAGANAIQLGLNPTQDLNIAFIQAAGRNIFKDFYNNDSGAMGEGLALAATLGIGGLKRLYNLQTKIKIPIVGDVVENAAFKSKLLIENLANIVLLGHGSGMLINPNLRSLNDMKSQLNIGDSGVRTIDNFVKNILKLPKQMKQADGQLVVDSLVKSMMESFSDIHLITKDIPEQFRGKIQNSLVLSLADASGLAIFQGYGLSLKLDALSYSKTQIKNLQRSVQDNISSQVSGEKRLNNFSAIVDDLNANILEMEQGGANVKPEILERLKTMSKSYESAARTAKVQFMESQYDQVNEINQFLAELSNPQNSELLKYYTQGDGGDNLLISLFTLRSRAENHIKTSSLDAAPTSATVEASVESMDLSQSQRNILKSKDNVAELALNLTESIVESNRRLVLTQTQSSAISNAGSTIKSFINITEAASATRVDKAYQAISGNQTIDFTRTSERVFDLFSVFAKQYDMDIARISNITTSPLLGSVAGRKLLTNIEQGSKRGMLKLFNDPDVLSMLNSTKGDKDAPFENGQQILDFFRQEATTNSAVRTRFGLGEDDTISNFQLLLHIKDQKGLNFNAEDLSFLTSPKEMEALRQSFQTFSKSNNDQVKGLGISMVKLIDEDFRTWTGTLNVDDYNKVIKARWTHRLEKQRFDENTMGDQLKKLMKGSPIKFVSSDGTMIDLTSKDLTKVFDPLIDAILKPSDKTQMFVETEMKRLIATFIPSKMPDNLLVKVGGKYVEPTESQVASMIATEFDLTTPEGIQGLTALRHLLSSLIKSRFIQSKGMDNVATQIKSGAEPDLLKMTSGKVEVPDLAGLNIPKSLPLPSGGQFKNHQDYIEKIESLIQVNVKHPSLGPEPISMPAFNLSALRTEEDITNAVMANKNFEEAHKEYFKLVKAESDKLDNVLLKEVEVKQQEAYQRTMLYRDQMDGDAFFNNIIMQGNPNSMDIYIRDIDNLVVAGKITQEQRDKTLQSLVVDVLRAAGGENRTGKTFKYYDGKKRNVTSYATPEVPFDLLTGFGDINKDGTRSALSIQSEKFKTLMNAAGVTEEQHKLFEALYRHGVKIDAEGVLKRAADTKIKGKGSNSGFTLNNTLSKAFNIARGMVSKEYVMAEMAIRYASLADGAVLNTIMNDEKVTNILTNLLTDPTKVLKDDADYFVKAIIKFSAVALRNIGLNHDSGFDKLNYWVAKGVTYPQTKKESGSIR